MSSCTYDSANGRVENNGEKITPLDSMLNQYEAPMESVISKLGKQAYLAKRIRYGLEDYSNLL